MLNNCQSLSDLKREFARLATLPDSAAVSLPPAGYASPELFRVEVQQIFEQEWVPLGRAEEIPEPGDYFTTELAGDPLLIVRGDDHEVRVLSNVCRHKWTVVASGQGNTRVFVCPYHAWTYARDGSLVGAKYMERTAGFKMQDCRLPVLRSEVWGGFVFVNLDPQAQPLAPRLSKLEPIVGNYHMQDMKRFTGGDEVWGYQLEAAGRKFHRGLSHFSDPQGQPAKRDTLRAYLLGSGRSGIQRFLCTPRTARAGARALPSLPHRERTQDRVDGVFVSFIGDSACPRARVLHVRHSDGCRCTANPVGGRQLW